MNGDLFKTYINNIILSSKLSHNYKELKRIALTIDCYTYVKRGLGENHLEFIDEVQDKIYDSDYIKQYYITAQEKEEKEEQRIKETIAAFKELQLNKKDVLK